MEFNFKVKILKPKLITKDEYPLFWWGEKNSTAPDKIGVCKVQIEEDTVICNSIIASGSIKHLINDIITSEFNPSDILSGRYEYTILLKEDVEGTEYVYGFCLL